MEREILYRAKSIYTGEWIEGFLIKRNKKSWIVAYSLDRDPVAIRDGFWYVNTPSALVDPKTVCQYANKTLSKGDKVFEGTIAFIEIEKDLFDERFYIVCVWIDEWSMFGWLELDLYQNYKEEGIDALEQYDIEQYHVGDCSHLHHAGNIFDNDINSFQ